MSLNSLPGAVTLFLLLSLVGCGGGGGGTSSSSTESASSPSPFVATPTDGAFVTGGSALTVTVRNTKFAESSGALYSFVLYDDAAGLSPIASVDGFEENSSGDVVWETHQAAADNLPYYWRWSVVYIDTTGAFQEEISPLLTIRATRDGALQAASPRNTGSMDTRNSATPELAVRNYYSGDTGVTITYDFDLYADPAGLFLMQAIRGVAQQSDDVHTGWAVQSGFPIGTTIERTPWGEERSVTSSDTSGDGVQLLEGGTYYWRARVVIDGAPDNWTDMYSFTVRDLCALSTSPYAEHITEWTKARHCDALAFTDTSQALGAPNASGAVGSYAGFVSIDIGGILGVEMGRTVYDGPGGDIRIWEYVALEPIELFAAMSEIGPWVSLGTRWCDPFCDWDLGSAGVRYARFFRIKDGWTDTACHSTSGSDIDSVMALHWVTDAGSQCGG